jgi:DNA-binding PadR family transcriptional regulator
LSLLTPLTYRILLALADAPLHGYGILKAVARGAEGEPEPEAGTLYAAIKRMRDEGLIDVAPAPRDERSDPRRRYYRLTASGRRAARKESERLLSLVELAREKKLLPRGSAS